MNIQLFLFIKLLNIAPIIIKYIFFFIIIKFTEIFPSLTSHPFTSPMLHFPLDLINTNINLKNVKKEHNRFILTSVVSLRCLNLCEYENIV